MYELLAPAGDIKCFDAAINCGADAVYLGLSDFNARMKADNFQTDTLRDHIKKAHFYGVKVYITINTILHNDEFKPLISMVKDAVLAKADAFIVQDLGALKVLRECFPHIVLHASTQMGIHNASGARTAEKLGFKRIVLSRETTLDDIKEIRRNTNLEIEYFVQGALCVCFSGNCYMSSSEQDASGNRGLCKQLCRLEYDVECGMDKGKGYFLSARDLCLIDKLKTLADAGVTSFKIEGRMRRDGYVAATVKEYRKAIDAFSSGKSAKADKNLLKTAFSRGEFLENAYLFGDAPSVIETKYNNHTGVKIGEVVKVEPFKQDLYNVTIKSAHKISEGDGLKFFDKGIEKASLGVGSVRAESRDIYVVYSKTKARAGWQVNLITDGAEEKKLAALKKYSSIKMRVNALSGKRSELYGEYETPDGQILCHTVKGETLEKARTAPTSDESIAEQCSKTADSGFNVEKIEIMTDGAFVLKSSLNALRRELLEGLKEKMIAYNERNINAVFDEKAAENLVKLLPERSIESTGGTKADRRCVASPNECADSQTAGEADGKILNVCFVREEDAAKSGVIASGESIVFCPANYDVRHILGALKILDVKPEDIILKLPTIANGKDLKIIKRILKDIGIRKLMSENAYGLDFAPDYEIIAGAGHNAANSFAIETLKDAGAKAVQLSSELKEDIPSVLPKVSGRGFRVPLMTFAHCPYKTFYSNDCAHCTYQKGLKLKRGKREYGVRRLKIARCYFELYAE